MAITFDYFISKAFVTSCHHIPTCLLIISAYTPMSIINGTSINMARTLTGMHCTHVVQETKKPS